LSTNCSERSGNSLYTVGAFFHQPLAPTGKRYVRGPYKTKRLKKVEEKEEGTQVKKMHKSTLKKAEIAQLLLNQMEGEQEEECTGKQCNCANSGCLKLYCECFKNNTLCGTNCRCQGCINTDEKELNSVLRRQAKE